MPLEKSILNKENIKQLLLERYGLHYLEDNHLSQGTANCFRIRSEYATSGKQERIITVCILAYGDLS